MAGLRLCGGGHRRRLHPVRAAEGALLPLLARTPQELSAANVAHNQTDSLGFLGASLATGALLALAGPEAAFVAAAGSGSLTAMGLARLSKDERPVFDDQEDAAGALREATAGIRVLFSDPKLRLVGLVFSALVFVEGAADVMIVIVALDLLGISEGSMAGSTRPGGGCADRRGGFGAAARPRQPRRRALGWLPDHRARLRASGIWPVVVAAYLCSC